MKNLLLSLFIIASPLNAGVYKWTDEKGNVYFGDKPVNNQSATELNIRTNNKTGVTNSSGNNKDRKLLLEEIEKEKEKKAEKNKKRLASNKIRKKLCDSYRRRYQSQIQSNRTYHMSPDGERTYLSENQRAARLKKINKGIAKYCH